MTVKEFLESECASINYPADILQDIIKEISIHLEHTAGKKSPTTIVWTDINWKYRYLEKEKRLIII